MVRTKDSASVKVAGAKAPRKITPASTSTESSSDSKKKYSGGNPYCPRETPAWQKPITSFFNPPSNSNGGSSSSTVVHDDSGTNPEDADITEFGESGDPGPDPQNAEKNVDANGGAAVISE